MVPPSGEVVVLSTLEIPATVSSRPPTPTFPPPSACKSLPGGRVADLAVAGCCAPGSVSQFSAQRVRASARALREGNGGQVLSSSSRNVYRSIGQCVVGDGTFGGSSRSTSAPVDGEARSWTGRVGHIDRRMGRRGSSLGD